MFDSCANQKSYTSKKSLDRASSTEEFLTTIGRGAQEKLKVESWEKLWTMDGHAMKDMGISVRDRRCGYGYGVSLCWTKSNQICRYYLWCMEKYRTSNGAWNPDQIVHDMKPKKKIRG